MKCWIVLIGLFAAACAPMGNYRLVKKVPSGGELALEGEREAARSKADDYMKSSCPGGFDVLEEGEEVIGASSQSESGTKSAVSFGHVGFGAKPVNSTETVNKTEWRVKFQCKTAPAAVRESPKPVGQIHELIVRF